MNSNLKIFIEVCKKENIPFQNIHECGNLLEIKAPSGQTFLFTAGATPFNSQSIYQLCKDKEFFYNYYQDVISMPRKKGFLNPNCELEHRDYLVFKTLDEIVEESEKQFTYPMIAKMNQGLAGLCVFKAHNAAELKTALHAIYLEDYIALVQEYIPIESEYRVIYFNKKLMFTYKKNNENAEFTGNLSPLHFKGAYAEVIEDTDLLRTFNNFVQPLFDKQNIPYCGLDIAIDINDKMWLIEGNCSPGFGYLLQAPTGPALVQNLYIEMFKSLGVIE